jgi:hypothetical protein
MRTLLDCAQRPRIKTPAHPHISTTRAMGNRARQNASVNSPAMSRLPMSMCRAIASGAASDPPKAFVGFGPVTVDGAADGTARAGWAADRTAGSARAGWMRVPGGARGPGWNGEMTAGSLGPSPNDMPDLLGMVRGMVETEEGYDLQRGRQQKCQVADSSLCLTGRSRCETRGWRGEAVISRSGHPNFRGRPARCHHN